MKQAALSFILALFPIMASADGNGTFGANLTWSYSEATSTLTISGTGAMPNYSIIYYGASVYIGTPWRYYVSSIKKINIESGVTSIGNCVFYDCSNLTSVTIPNSVTRIGDNAFYCCRGLTSVTIPNSVMSIGNNAFQYCIGLTSVTILNSVTSIGNNAFQYCSSLKSVTIPNSVTSIGNSAFGNCSGLETIVSEIKTPFVIGSIGDTSITLIVPAGTKADYQSTAGWSSFTNMVEVGEGGVTGSKFEIDGIRYTIDENNKASLISANGVKSGVLVIPGQVEFNGKKYDVTSIGNSAFGNCSGLTSVTIPNSVTSIGESAFYGCSGLTSITIPNSVTSIGNQAFYYCSGLTSFTIPNSVTSIGNSAFGYCSGLKIIVSEIKTPFEVGYIGDNSVTLIVPAGTKATYQSTAGWNSFTKTVEVGEGVFAGCSFEIEGFCYTVNENNTASIISANKAISGSFVIPDQVDLNGKKYEVTSIGNSAFQQCRNLDSVTIPNNVTSIGNKAFYECSGITSVIIGSGVTSIGSDAFWRAELKKTIWLCNTPPSGYSYAAGTVNYVSNDQFGISNQVVYKYLSSNFVVDGIRYVPVSPSDYTCDAIDCIYDESAENINIGETVVNKGITLTVKKVNPYTCYRNIHIKDVKLSFGGDLGDYAFFGCININKADLSNKGHIGNRAFYVCIGINELSLRNDGNIGEYAFCGCTGMNSVVISNKGHIGNNAFYACSGFAFANINNHGDIGQEAFAGCGGITSANINNHGDIGQEAFAGCSGITSATISNQGYIGEKAFTACTSLVSAKIQNKGAIKGNAFSGSIALETVELGEEVTSLGLGAFKDCPKLKSIIIPDAVSSVGAYAFQNCTAMTSAKIGNGIETIDEYSFSGCSAINEINIGSKVKTINQYAFSGCLSLSAITIPQAVTTIGNYVFSNCTSLAKVTIADSETTLTLGSNGSNPIFSSCPLDYVYVGRDISYKTSSSYGYSPFYRNTKLREVKTTNKETEISDNEFYGCTNLQTVTIGDGVTTIGKWAFSGCSSLKYFTFGSKLESIGQEAFSDCTSLVLITSKAKKAPACGSQALEDINKWECKLNVPKGYLSVYKAADQWMDFWFMEEGEYIPPLKGDVNSDGNVDKNDLKDLVEYIMGNKPNGVTDESANVNGDTKVDVADVVALVALLN